MSDRLMEPVSRGRQLREGADLAQLRQETDELRVQLARAEETAARLPDLVSQLGELVKLNDELLQANDELAQRQQDFDGLVEIAERYAVVVNSTSWRLTRPARQTMELVRRLLR